MTTMSCLHATRVEKGNCVVQERLQRARTAAESVDSGQPKLDVAVQGSQWTEPTRTPPLFRPYWLLVEFVPSPRLTFGNAGAECVYDAKVKPGLKTGAVDALSRRLAKLEHLLLDEKGVPYVTFKDHGACCRLSASRVAAGAEANGSRNQSEPDISLNEVDFTDMCHGLSSAASVCSHRCERSSRRERSTLIGNIDLHGDEEEVLLQALPSQEVLTQVVDYFCVSFHHWIPYLHKGKLKEDIKSEALRLNLAPVLHALTATVLPRLGDICTILGHAELHRQTLLSRNLALQYSMMNASLRSLQTLVLLVFEQITDGHILQASPLIASLVRTVDFLQLTTEPNSSRPQALMRPWETMEPTTDWTELEARRRLFWCIFAMDRHISALTGWNTSLDAVDVKRRLPADGGYFAREEPVNCPYFGLWNKAHANIGSPLATHVPTQYRERSPPTNATEIDTTTPGSIATVDSSKLGAFAYSIEAVESLHQVTTFFLQQHINWHNKQHVLDWLTRFKELDLRLIHWKMFLPPRWKDSDISVDTEHIDMDPNLTVAHLTHNASMILLHFPVAFPPHQWVGAVPLPSECSMETCRMAAVEIHKITDKFLRNTSIPFVSPQFSFCVYVAAKVLLAISQSNKTQSQPEFEHLLQALWRISKEWLQWRDTDQSRPAHGALNASTDLAGSYASRLERLKVQCEEDGGAFFDFFDHCSDQKPSHSLMPRISSVAGPSGIHRQTSTTVSGAQHAGRNRRQKRASQKRNAASRSTPIDTNAVGHSPASLPIAAFQARQESTTEDMQPEPSRSAVVLPYGQANMVQLGDQQAISDVDWLHGPLFDLSDALMQPQFFDQDRIITFEDTYFQHSNMDWS